MFTELQQMRQQLPDMEFGRRMAVERELEKVDGIRLTNIIFDETGHFVLYGTMLGIKVINVETNRYVHMKTEKGSVLQFLAVPKFITHSVVIMYESNYSKNRSFNFARASKVFNKQQVWLSISWQSGVTIIIHVAFAVGNRSSVLSPWKLIFLFLKSIFWK